MRSWNIKTNFIEKVSCLGKLIATIRKSYIYIYSASIEDKVKTKLLSFTDSSSRMLLHES